MVRLNSEALSHVIVDYCDIIKAKGVSSTEATVLRSLFGSCPEFCNAVKAIDSAVLSAIKAVDAASHSSPIAR